MASPFKRIVLGRLMPPLIARVLAWMRRTQQIHTEGIEHVHRARREGHPLVGASFHGRMLPTILHTCVPPFGPWTMLASLSNDAQILGHAIEHLGYSLIHGSTSRGGARALIQMIRHGKRHPNDLLGVTVDGPRGPRGRVQEGAILIAQKTGGMILPMSAATSRHKILKRAWDHHMAPLPAGHLYGVYGEPIAVPRKMTPQQFEEIRLQVEEAILAVTLRADQLAGFENDEPYCAPLERDGDGR